MKVLVLHGVNLDMFGKRDPAMYGTITLGEIDARLRTLAGQLGVEVETFHTNVEGVMCERVHAAHGDGTGAVVINAGAWTHYSYALRDALELVDAPVVEVHLSDIASREEWRQRSVVEDVVALRVIGKGPGGYREALAYLAEHCK